ncbi:MAG: hypothetical protein AAGK33_06050 [Pseudomonadota bacterium]
MLTLRINAGHKNCSSQLPPPTQGLPIEGGQIPLIALDFFTNGNGGPQLLRSHVLVGGLFEAFIPYALANMIQHNALKAMILPHRPMPFPLACRRWQNAFCKMEIALLEIGYLTVFCRLFRKQRNLL